jgi:peptidyl-prolyl cis-trans isomerase B (cyclophilin B)
MKKKIQQIQTRKRALCCTAIVCMVLLLAAAGFAAAQSPRTTAAGVHSYADIAVENYGTITVALDSDDAPKTVENFVSLAQSGFYDGLTFHRIIDGFMIQGGDPNGDGTGGAQQTVEGEFSANGVNNTLSHVRGVISMARSSDYNSASSQFFIVQTDSTYLDGSYAAFGYVIDGMEIVDALCADANPIDSNGTISANEQPRITSITIRSDETTA